MPRRKAAEAELLLPEDTQPSRGRKKLVEAEHTIKYSAPVPVTVEESEDSDLDLLDDAVIEDKPRRKVNSERDELRKKLAKSNITPGSQLKLTIERYTHSDVIDSQGGMFAETEHCNKYVCAESHITSEDYLDVARKFGPGLYRFTLRMKNQIVTAWDKRISTGVSTPMIQHANPNDPSSPQFIVQMPEGSQQPVSVIDPLKQMREAAKFYKEMKQTFEPEGAQPQQQPKSEEEVLASAILNRPEVIDNLIGSVMKRAGAKGDSDEPWYADVVRDAVKSGQLAQVVQVTIDRIFNGVNNLFPGRQNNGQVPTTQTPTSETTVAQTTAPTQHISDSNALLSDGVQPAHSERTGAGASGVTPAEQALMTVMADCQKKIPPQITFTNLMSFADAVNDQAPAYSIDGWIEYFGGMSVDGAIEFVKTLPNGEAVASLPHCREWTEALQKLIKESQEGEEE